MSYIPLPQKTEGDRPQVSASDMNAYQLLVDILKEIKKMNFQLSLITDENITNQEID